jgi:hypothetical protein
MKKLIAFVVLVLMISTTAQSQDIYYSTHVSEGFWSSSSEKWIWAQPRELTFRFTIQSNVILVNDKAGSTYNLTKLVMDTENLEVKEIGWEAIDEKRRPCFVKFRRVKKQGAVGLYVLYGDTGYCYTMDQP